MLYILLLVLAIVLVRSSCGEPYMDDAGEPPPPPCSGPPFDEC